MRTRPRLRRAVALSIVAHGALLVAIALLAYAFFAEDPTGGGTIGVWVEAPEGFGSGGLSASAPGRARRQSSPALERAQSGRGATASEEGRDAASLPQASDAGAGSAAGSGVAGVGGGAGEGSGTGRDGDPRLAQIWRKINAAKYYPASMRRRGLTGKPRVAFAIGDAGALQWVRLAESCGVPELDEAALETVRRAVPLPVYPRPIQLTITYAMER